MNDKNECVESITTTLDKTSAWRKSLAIRYPDDAARNLRAAETLSRLAQEAASLTDEHFAALSPHFNWASERWPSAVNETARGVGFLHPGVAA